MVFWPVRCAGCSMKSFSRCSALPNATTCIGLLRALLWPFATNDASAPPASSGLIIRQDTFAEGRQAQGLHLQQVLVGRYVVYLPAYRVRGHLGVSSNTHHLDPGLRWYRRSRHWFGRQGQGGFLATP